MGIYNFIIRTENSTATLTNNLTAGANQLTYTGTDVFVQGQLIAIDNEIMGCGAVNTTNNTVNLVRGALDTTEAAHSAGASIRFVRRMASAEMVSDAEELVAADEIVEVWAPNGNANQAAARSLKAMISQWRDYTIARLFANDIADEEATLEAAKTTTLQALRNRYKEAP